MNSFFKFSPNVLSAADKAIKSSRDAFERIAEITAYNQQKVLRAFIDNGVSESHFAATTGYGYGDRGREVIESVFAQCVGAEDSIFRHNFMSGTHTLAVALFGVLRPGDKMLCLTGKPYDTLLGVIGKERAASGSLVDFGVEYDEVPVAADGYPDIAAIRAKMAEGRVKMAYIQRSKGYSSRKSLSVAQIGELCRVVKEISPTTIVMVDNCYGEFVEKMEPTQVGADLMAGSLIKNPGGAIAPTGGYIAGRADLVEQCAFRLSAPGVGKEIGATLGHSRELFMGLFNAPHVVGEALKTAVFSAELYKILGYNVAPDTNDARADIIQTVEFKEAQELIDFCQGMQSGSPVDSFAVPQPWDMPGYDNQVIMAAGAFTGGASIELSADAPIREPYTAFMQGGINFDSAKVGVMLAAQKICGE